VKSGPAVNATTDSEVTEDADVLEEATAWKRFL
jgi:hypothetical protein